MMYNYANNKSADQSRASAQSDQRLCYSMFILHLVSITINKYVKKKNEPRHMTYA